VAERTPNPTVFSNENGNRLLTPEQLKKYSYLIHLAGEASAYPDQSGYFVRTAGITEHGTFHTGGNKEYGHSDAFIHGETAVVSGLRDLTSDRIEAIAWYQKGEIKAGDCGRPCGNCRDVLSKYCDPDLVLLNGNENAFVLTHLRDYLFEDFKKVNLDKYSKYYSNGYYLNIGIDAARKGNDIYLPEKMKQEVYGAVLVSKRGKSWSGSHYSNVAYDSVTPVMNAIINWYGNYPRGSIAENLRLEKLLIVGEKINPHVFYRDRQAILELDEILRKFTNNPNPLRVEIVNVEQVSLQERVVKEVYETNTEEWLPRPFSPGAFRMDDVMAGQLGKLIGEENLLPKYLS
jgi:cytidine deaminase